MQSTELADDIKRLFHNSPMAAAAVGEGGRVLYRNPACEQLCPDIDLSCFKTGISCEMYRLCHSQNKVYKLSVSPVSDSVSLVNITLAGFDDSVFDGMSATIGKTFNLIAETMNELSDHISDENALNMLDEIDGNMLSAYSELLVPRAVSHMRLAGDSPFIVSISGEFLKFMEQLSYMTAAESIFFGDFENIKSGLTARMDINALRLLMLEFIADCKDKYNVHGISPFLKKKGADTILLELSCGYLGRVKAKVSSRVAVAEKKQCGYDPFKMLSEELEKRYGCRISLRHSNDVSTLSVEMPFAEGECTGTVNSSMAHYIVTNRFADISLYCARYAMNHRYKLGRI